MRLVRRMLVISWLRFLGMGHGNEIREVAAR